MSRLAYQLVGVGVPVVLIHAGVLSCVWCPLVTQPALVDDYRLLCYHRAGYGNSDRLPGPVTIADHAAHCRQLMRHVGIARAHVVAHSSSATIALQLALHRPEAVHSLSLVEPARPHWRQIPRLCSPRPSPLPALQRYASGDTGGAGDRWMRGVAGPAYRRSSTPRCRALSRGSRQCRHVLRARAARRQTWSFTADDAARITQPVLAVLGTNSVPTFAEPRRLLCDRIPECRVVRLSRRGPPPARRQPATDGRCSPLLLRLAPDGSGVITL